MVHDREEMCKNLYRRTYFQYTFPGSTRGQSRVNGTSNNLSQRSEELGWGENEAKKRDEPGDFCGRGGGRIEGAGWVKATGRPIE